MPHPAPAAVISPATAEALELATVLALVAELTATDLGRRRVEALAPVADRERLERRRRRYLEAARLVAERRLVPGFEEPPGALLAQLESGRPPVTGATLVGLGDLLRVTGEARQRVLSSDPPLPELAELAAALEPLSELEGKIRRVFDPRGEVRDDASPRLVQLKREVRRRRDDLYGQLREIVSTRREHLSEETIPLRDGRLVLVLAAGSRGRMDGLTHGRSGTGKSFYFEPLTVVEGNNRLQQSVADEETERARIVNELAAEVRARMSAIRLHAELLAELDQLQAAARFAELADARLAELGPRHELSLVAARHPLLDPALGELRLRALGQGGHEGAVVPLDVELSAERRAVVITGPNAGGKTVALKTVGLAALMTQCALPVPVAAGSRVPHLTRLVATVGDEQDLLADRSTFSGRLLRLEEAWQAAGPDSLVLLDELGSGTDPEEGAALAIALVEELLDQRALTLVTTHLTPLAAAALELPEAGCAAMELDPASGEPTFRLRFGPPGGSEALALAARLGLPSSWLERAEQHLGPGHRDLRQLLAEVEKARADLAEQQRRLAAEQAAAERETARLERQREALEVERKTVGKRLKAELEQFQRTTRERLRSEVERLRDEVTGGRRRGLAAKAEERLFAAAPELVPEEPETGVALAEGGLARHRTLGWQGVVEKLDGKRAAVRIKGKRVRCLAADLVGVDAAAAPPSPRRRPVAPVPDAEGDDPGTEIKLIGQRVEPALAELDAYLDQALLASAKTLRVVHGHGTGALKKAVRSHLRAHPGVATLRPGGAREGGDGATVVTLKG